MILIYFLICFIQPILLFTPEIVTITGGSIAFGPFLSFIVGYTGILSGIIVMYLIGRFAQAKVMYRLEKKNPLQDSQVL